MPKLTKKYLETIVPQDKEKIYWDAGYKGFGVRVSPAGRKTFVVQYRLGSRTRRVSLGTFGNLTVEEARKKTKKILGSVAGGDDPAERISIFRKTPTMEEPCQRFIKEHVETRLKPSTQREYCRNIRLYILPKFRTFKVSEVKIEDVAQIHYELAHKPAYEVGTVFMLNIDLSILGAEKHVYEQFEKDVRKEYKRVPSFFFKRNGEKF